MRAFAVFCICSPVLHRIEGNQNNNGQKVSTLSMSRLQFHELLYKSLVRLLKYSVVF